MLRRNASPYSEVLLGAVRSHAGWQFGCCCCCHTLFLTDRCACRRSCGQVLPCQPHNFRSTVVGIMLELVSPAAASSWVLPRGRQLLVLGCYFVTLATGQCWTLQLRVDGAVKQQQTPGVCICTSRLQDSGACCWRSRRVQHPWPSRQISLRSWLQLFQLYNTHVVGVVPPAIQELQGIWLASAVGPCVCSGI